MVKLIIFGFIIWSILFVIRILSIGGLDPTYRDSGSEVLSSLREDLSKNIDQTLPQPQSALLSGILLGKDDNIPFDLKRDLQATSTIHLVVVSGQNLTVLAGFVMNLVYIFGRRKTVILTLLAITFYSLLTGLGVPIIRAAIMATLTYLAQIMGKEKLSGWILFLTGGGMLIYNPNWLMSISFQLSFVATFGVVVVAPILISLFKFLPKIIKEDFSISLAAYLLTLPIIAYNFGQVSLFGIITNTLIIWTSPLILISGFLTLIVSSINNLLGQIVGLFPSILITYFLEVVKLFASLPNSLIVIGQTESLLWIGYYILLASLIWVLKLKVNSDQIEVKTNA